MPGFLFHRNREILSVGAILGAVIDNEFIKRELRFAEGGICEWNKAPKYHRPKKLVTLGCNVASFFRSEASEVSDSSHSTGCWHLP